MCVCVCVCVCSYNFEEQLQEAWPIKCCFVVKEIMQTEIAYVQALADIIKVWSNSTDTLAQSLSKLTALLIKSIESQRIMIIYRAKINIATLVHTCLVVPAWKCVTARGYSMCVST